MRYDEHPDRNCAGQNPEPWFPDRNNQREMHAAKALCNGCPVKQACLDDALRHETGLGKGSREGIFGGKTPAERYALERKGTGEQSQRRRISHGTEGGYRTHLRRKEAPCDPCAEAAMQAARRRRERAA